MKFTDFLDKPEIKERLRQEFTMPKLAEKREIIARPISTQYGLVGTAFDYLLRFYIEKHNPNAISTEWIAESWLKSRARSREERGREKKRIEVEAEKLIKRARKLNSKHISSSQNRIEKDLIETAIQLAYIDNMYRAPVYYDSLPDASNEDIDDLRNLLKIVDPAIFKSQHTCLLNPTFGETAKMIGGADADLLIDNIIIEIKTTKNFVLKRKDFNQLLGYYFLHELDGIGQVTPKLKVTKLAIYFSRFAYLHVFDLEEIINKNTFPTFLNWFRNKASEIDQVRKQAKVDYEKRQGAEKQSRIHIINQQEEARLFRLKNRKHTKQK